MPTSFSVTPAADAYVDGANTGTNFGSSASLRVDGSPIIRSYLRFTVSGLAGAPVAAKLRILPTSSSGTGFGVHAGSSATWAENTITYANAPSYTTTPLTNSGATTSGTWKELDLTSHITGNGTYTLVLTGTSSTGINLASRESANTPQLVITTTAGSPPAAENVAETGQEDTSTAWTPLVSDPDSATFTCAIAVAPAHGTATVPSDCSTGSYSPSPNWNGPDTFVYSVTDGFGSDTGTVTVAVGAVNDQPVATAASAAATAGQTVQVNLGGSDVDGSCPVSFVVTTPPTHGSLGSIGDVACNAGLATTTITYTANSGFAGSDSFEYAVNDGQVSSDPATITLAVSAVQTTVSLSPVADAYVSASATTTNFGSSTSLRVDGSPIIRSYLRFTVTGLTGAPTAVKLRIQPTSTSGTGFSVHAGSTTAWAENTITYANAPSYTAAALAASGPTTSGTWKELDVTNHITGNGTYTLVLTGTSSTGINLASRETTNSPQLVIAT